MATSKQILEQFLPTLVHCSITLITCWLENCICGLLNWLGVMRNKNKGDPN